MANKKNITGIILAGGKSSRMGTDKGFIVLNDMLFVEHIIKALQPLVGKIIIVSNNSNYDKFGFKRVPDLIKNSGPLAGLYSGLFHSETDNNLVLSCDIPFINTEVLQLLVNNIENDFQIIQFKSQNKTMPLISLYKKECLETCKALLNKGEKRLRQVMNHVHTKTITIDPNLEHYVQNINTIEQLNQIRNAIEH